MISNRNQILQTVENIESQLYKGQAEEEEIELTAKVLKIG